MATAYTSLLGLALPVTGELSGTWGNAVNTEITALLDSAVAGTTSITVDADITLTTTTGAANEAREAIILWTAGGTVTRNITAPAQSKAYIVINKSSSTQSIVLRGAGPTTGVTIVKDEKAVCAWNGSDFVKIANISGAGAFTDLYVSGNAGIGTSSPSTYANGFGPVLVTGTGNNFATIQGRTDGPTGLTNGVSYGGSYSTNPINGARMTLNAEGGSGQRGSVSFWTKALDDNSTQPIERARITQAGVLQFNSGYGSVANAYGCRAWCQYNNSQAIVGSANISSITVNGTGDVTLNFSTAMPDANYSAVASTNEDSGTAKFCNPTQPSTTTIRVVTYTIAGTTTNNTFNFVAVFR